MKTVLPPLDTQFATCKQHYIPHPMPPMIQSTIMQSFDMQLVVMSATESLQKPQPISRDRSGSPKGSKKSTPESAQQKLTHNHLAILNCVATWLHRGPAYNTAVNIIRKRSSIEVLYCSTSANLPSDSRYHTEMTRLLARAAASNNLQASLVDLHECIVDNCRDIILPMLLKLFLHFSDNRLLPSTKKHNGKRSASPEYKSHPSDRLLQRTGFRAQWDDIFALVGKKRPHTVREGLTMLMRGISHSIVDRKWCSQFHAYELAAISAICCLLTDAHEKEGFLAEEMVGGMNLMGQYYRGIVFVEGYLRQGGYWKKALKEVVFTAVEIDLPSPPLVHGLGGSITRSTHGSPQGEIKLAKLSQAQAQISAIDPVCRLGAHLANQHSRFTHSFHLGTITANVLSNIWLKELGNQTNRHFHTFHTGAPVTMAGWKLPGDGRWLANESKVERSVYYADAVVERYVQKEFNQFMEDYESKKRKMKARGRRRCKIGSSALGNMGSVLAEQARG